MSDSIIYYFSTVIVSILHVFSYKEITSNKKITFNISKLLFIFVISFITQFFTLSSSVLKPLFSYVAMAMCDYIVYKDNINKLFTGSMISYILVVIAEILLSIIFTFFNVINLDAFNKMIIFKCIFSIITLLISYFLCKCKFMKKICNKFIELLSKTKKSIFILFIFMIIPIVIDYTFTDEITSNHYALNMVLLIIFEFILFYTINNEIKLNKEMSKYENLLNFISKYEKIIDNQRINKHEMHNNLLILKSYKNKNTKEYNDTLNSLIDLYSKSDDSIKNMYKLPSGIKGIIYYKLMNVDKYKIKLDIRISKQLKFKILKTNNKEYYNLCKVLSIVLDNAIDASKESKNKIINVEIYAIKDQIIFYIANSFGKKLEMNKLSNMNYSTKGKGRGLGLFVANNILSESNLISMEQNIEDNLFVTKIYVDN